MVNQGLINWVEESRKRGFSDKKLREHLVANGFDTNEVEDALNKAESPDNKKEQKSAPSKKEQKMQEKSKKNDGKKEKKKLKPSKKQSSKHNSGVKILIFLIILVLVLGALSFIFWDFLAGAFEEMYNTIYDLL